MVVSGVTAIIPESIEVLFRTRALLGTWDRVVLSPSVMVPVRISWYCTMGQPQQQQMGKCIKTQVFGLLIGTGGDDSGLGVDGVDDDCAYCCCGWYV